MLGLSNRKKLVLVGGGGHCESVIDTLRGSSTYYEVVICDPNLTIGNSVLEVTVVGDDDMLSQLHKEGYAYSFVSMGSITDTSKRKMLFDKTKKLGYLMPYIVECSAIVADDGVLEEGVFCGKNTIVNAGSRIGKAVIVNTGAIVEHNCSIGDFSHISVRSVICGGCAA